MEAAAVQTTTASPNSTPAAPSSAGSTLNSVPTGGEWLSGFKSEETRSYISNKKFQSPEALAESYKNLEAKLSTRHPEDRTIFLPEKMEGEAVKNVFQRLGMPKEMKDYDFAKDDKTADPKTVEAFQNIFYENNLTKDQAAGVAKKYTEYVQGLQAQQQEAHKNALIQGEAALKKEWGSQYEANINIAKQGAKILGLDAKTLDAIEASQGRESLFKTLQRIGVSVGESGFVDGSGAGAGKEMTAEQASAEIQRLYQDKKFQKKFNNGDRETIDYWNKINQLAAPGEKQIG